MSYRGRARKQEPKSGHPHAVDVQCAVTRARQSAGPGQAQLPGPRCQDAAVASGSLASPRTCARLARGLSSKNV
eukprot:2496556-Prymnesium_polylepis.1